MKQFFFFAAESEGYCLRLTNINMDCWPGGASGQKLAEIYPNSLPKGFSKPLQNKLSHAHVTCHISMSAFIIPTGTICH